MNFEVRLRDSAADEMLVQYVRAANKPAIFAASGRIERELGDDPHSAGEERGGNTRVLVVRPLLVMYSIDDAERVVFIERIRWVGL